MDGTGETILDTLRTGDGGAPAPGGSTAARPGDIRPGATFEVPGW